MRAKDHQSPHFRETLARIHEGYKNLRRSLPQHVEALQKLAERAAAAGELKVERDVRQMLQDLLLTPIKKNRPAKTPLPPMLHAVRKKKGEELPALPEDHTDWSDKTPEQLEAELRKLN